MATEADCLATLRAAAQELGESPTKAPYEALGLTPAASTVLRVCGGWNEAKEAAGLETNPSTGSRVTPQPDDVSLPEGTAWADLSQDQWWHYRNVEHNTERTLLRRQRLREWVNERKRERGCATCEVSDPRCLDFHHTDPGEKRRSIGELVRPRPRESPDRDGEVRGAVCELSSQRTQWREPVDGPQRVGPRTQATGWLCTLWAVGSRLSRLSPHRRKADNGRRDGLCRQVKGGYCRRDGSVCRSLCELPSQATRRPSEGR
jgi:hypothetical protein